MLSEPIPLSSFEEFPLPDREQWYQANHCRYSWTVSLKDGNIRVTIDDGMHRCGKVHRLDHGWLVGMNHGEWGGGMIWRETLEDSSKDFKITKRPVCDFVYEDGKILSFEGLAHLGQNKGEVIQSSGKGRSWTSHKLADLGRAPEAIFRRDDGSFLVATHSDLRMWTAPDQVKILGGGWWGSLYPTSIVESPSGQICIGMRRGIVIFTRASPQYRQAWLLPRQEPVIRS
jgi:hypothetical protein